MAKQPTTPRHIGLILDGNRRWAKQQGLPSLEGHKRGYQNLIDRADYLISRGVEYVSAYTFSTENWNRSEEEVSYLMDLSLRVATKDVETLHKKDIRVRWVGREEGLSKKLIKAIADAEEKTKNNKRGTLGLCFNYGGHMEISDALNSMIAAGIEAAAVTPELINEYLYAPDIPPIDLVIRTSGEQRLSNFMLWRVSYAELLFLEKHWPAIGDEDLAAALEDYAERQRRFGA